MSDETTTTNTTLETSVADESATHADDAAVDYKTEAEKWKALARKHERMAKTNAEAAKRVAELEDARSDAEKLAARVAELEQVYAQATAEAARQRIVNELGIPADIAADIAGNTPEEFRAAAERVKARLAPVQKFGPVDTGPKNVVDNGLPKQLTHTDIAGMSPAQVEAARQAGQLADLLGQR